MYKAQIQRLNRRYAEACEDYLKAFCEAYELPYESDSWVAGDVGTICCTGDYYFDFNDVVKYAVDNNLNDWHELLEWYDYTIFANGYGLGTPNFQSWHKGCPRLSKEEQERLKERREALERLLQEYRDNMTQTLF